MAFGNFKKDPGDERVLMTRPDGQPAMVPGDLVEKYIFRKGFKKGYTPPKQEKKEK